MRHKGKIASWKDDKGFGFIAPFDGGKKVFIHIKAFKNRSHRPAVNEVVSYSVAKDVQGRTHAVNATLAGDKLPKMAPQASNLPAVFFAILFLIVVAVSVFAAGLPFIIFGAYLFVSTVTYLAYAIDKSAAQAGRWRISEQTLQLLALVGGWPGAVLAQQQLRHKSKKGTFRIVLWIAVLLNCAGFAWLHTSGGHEFLLRHFS
jgi:uncharacterized membrane protein YsdA (DUF1294 family)/cold shock CspA family protein